MKAARCFAAAALGMAFMTGAQPVMAEREGPFVHQALKASPPVKGSPSTAERKSVSSWFDTFRHKRSRKQDAVSNPRPEKRLAQAVEVEPPPAIEQISAYQPERMVPLSANSFIEPRPSDPLAAAIYEELLDQRSAIRVTPAQETAILALYKSNGFKPIWTTASGLSARGKEVLAFLSSSAEDGM